MRVVFLVPVLLGVAFGGDRVAAKSPVFVIDDDLVAAAMIENETLYIKLNDQGVCRLGDFTRDHLNSRIEVHWDGVPITSYMVREVSVGGVLQTSEYSAAAGAKVVALDDTVP